MSQIEALRKEARLYIASNKGSGAGALGGDGAASSAAGPGGSGEHGGEGSPQAQLEAMKKALNEAKENEVCEHLQATAGAAFCNRLRVEQVVLLASIGQPEAIFAQCCNPHIAVDTA
jgi:hypothetical protein